MRMDFDRNDPDYAVYRGLVEGQIGFVPQILIGSGDRSFASAELACGSRRLGLTEYFRAGMQEFEAVSQIVSCHFSDTGKVSRFLDFASGFGRSTRYFQASLGPERVWAADVQPEALRFQREQLGVHALLSTPKPEAFKPGLTFDCIFVGSLFGHLPETTFTRWLWKLYSLLTPGGLLIFGTRNQATLPGGVALPKGGIHFTPQVHSPALNLGDYGDTSVADTFVHSAIHAVTGVSEFQGISQALGSTRDLYVVAKGKLQPQPLPFHYAPNGCVDSCRWIAAEQMKVTGWAFDPSSEQQVARVDVYYNGALRGSCQTDYPRPDVAGFLGRPEQAEAVSSGWDCTFDLPDQDVRPEQDWLLIKAVSTTGKQSILRMDHPSQIDGFESFRDGSSVLQFIDRPQNGRLTAPNPELIGWLAAKEADSLEGLSLEGCFGPVPYSKCERPDVVACFPDLASMGFEAVLPQEYLTVSDPRLRFVTSSGAVLATLDSVGSS